MSFFSSWSKAMFLIALTFPLYCEASFKILRPNHAEPDCDAYKDRLSVCTKEWRPICGTNGRIYSNTCIFCSNMIESNRTFGFHSYGEC